MRKYSIIDGSASMLDTSVLQSTGIRPDLSPPPAMIRGILRLISFKYPWPDAWPPWSAETTMSHSSSWRVLRDSIASNRRPSCLSFVSIWAIYSGTSGKKPHLWPIASRSSLPQKNMSKSSFLSSYSSQIAASSSLLTLILSVASGSIRWLRG